MDLSNFTGFAGRFKKATQWLSQADGLLNDLHRAKEAGPLGLVLGVASSTARVIEAFLPSPSAEEQVKNMGWEPIKTGIAGFLAQAILRSKAPRTIVNIEEPQVTKRLIIFENNSAALLCQKDKILAGPYVRSTSDMSAFRSLLASVVWTSGDLTLDTSRGGGSLQGENEYGESVESEAGHFALTEMQAPGCYFGEPEVSYYVERLKKHFAARAASTRSILLIGPSGAGKTTLGRLVGAELAQGAKTLKISAKAVRRLTAIDLSDVVYFLSPEVLLIDDVANLLPRSEYDHNDSALDLLESLRGKAKLIILTLMDDHDTKKDYMAGMRPGRVDEVFQIKKPSVRVIEKILKHYLSGVEVGSAFKDIARMCRKAGLTGAYLEEVALRIRIHGVQHYKKEIETLVASAPKPPAKKSRPQLARAKMTKKEKEKLTRDIKEQVVADLAKESA